MGFYTMAAPQVSRTLRHQASRRVRCYATESQRFAASQGGNAVYGVLGVSALGLGYYYYSQGVPRSELERTQDSGIIQSSRQDAPAVFRGGDQGWIDLKLVATEDYNHNTKRLRFHLDDDSVSGLKVASCLLTRTTDPKTGKPVIRPYTPVSDEGMDKRESALEKLRGDFSERVYTILQHADGVMTDARGHLDLLVKKYSEGPMSTHLHDMSPYQRLDFKGPIPKYPWEPNKHKQIALIAGGTGITPMYQLARAIFDNPSDKTKVTLVFGNITEEDILLKEEFEHLENMFPHRFKAFYVLEQPAKGWPHPPGRITQELLKTVLPEPKEDNIKIFVCGPPGMYKAISGEKKSPKDQGPLAGLLKDLSYSEEQVYKF